MMGFEAISSELLTTDTIFMKNYRYTVVFKLPKEG
jgi:hypothetical protein